MASQSVASSKSSPANNFRAKPTPPTSNIVTAPSKAVVKEPPPLFPPNPMLDGLPKPKSNNDVYLLRKSVSLKQLFRSSPFFLQPQHKTKDIERYSDTYLAKEPILDVDNIVVASSGMFPAELLSEKDKKLLRANLLKRKLPDVTPQPISNTFPDQSTKKGKKKSETTSKAKRKKENSEMDVEDVPAKQKGTKGKTKKAKEPTKSAEKEAPARLTKLTSKINQNRDEMDFLEKLEEQEAKETEDIDDDQELTTPKKKKTDNDLEDEDNEQQVDTEDADDHLLDDEDYHNLFDNDDVEDDYNDAGGSDGEPFMD